MRLKSDEILRELRNGNCAIHIYKYKVTEVILCVDTLPNGSHTFRSQIRNIQTGTGCYAEYLFQTYPSNMVTYDFRKPDGTYGYDNTCVNRGVIETVREGCKAIATFTGVGAYDRLHY